MTFLNKRMSGRSGAQSERRNGRPDGPAGGADGSTGATTGLSRASRPFSRSRLALASLSLALFAAFSISSGAHSQSTEAEELSEEDASALPDSLAFELLRMMAREDTFETRGYILNEYIDSQEDRPTLKEIIGWCIGHAENRLDGVDDVQYRVRNRSIEYYGDPEDADARHALSEEVEQIYLKHPGEVLRIKMGERTWDSKEEDESDEDLEITMDALERDLSNLPIFFTALDEYEFTILNRRLFPDRILYKIAFTPRSEHASLPIGTFLVDTADYQIVRSEYEWTDNVPYPLFLKSIEKVLVERKKVDGFWFTDRMQATIHLRKIPLVPMPRRIEIYGQLEDLKVNAGIPDSVWEQR